MCVHREPIIRGQFVLFVKKEQIRLESSAFLFGSGIYPINYILKKDLSTYQTIHVCTLLWDYLFLLVMKNSLEICRVDLTKKQTMVNETWFRV